MSLVRLTALAPAIFQRAPSVCIQPARAFATKAPPEPVQTRVARPLSSYTVFIREMMRKESGSEKKMTMKDAGIQWKTMSEAEKEKYKAMAEEENQNRPERPVRVKLTEKSKKKRSEDAMPRSLSAFNVFVKELSAQAEGATQVERVKNVARQWKTISEEQKATWQAKADQTNIEREAAFLLRTAKKPATVLNDLPGTRVKAGKPKQDRRKNESDDESDQSDDDRSGTKKHPYKL